MGMDSSGECRLLCVGDGSSLVGHIGRKSGHGQHGYWVLPAWDPGEVLRLRLGCRVAVTIIYRRRCGALDQLVVPGTGPTGDATKGEGGEER